jgi:predicted metal-dependent HD superfamily phosphohydrolase
MNEVLAERFRRDLFPHVPPTQLPEIRELFRELEVAYTSSDRHYHNLDHIENCLNVFEAVNHRAVLRMDIVAAIYFHDVIYDSAAKDNEERSADFAVLRLRDVGFHGGFSTNVRRIILGTKHLGGLADYSSQVMADVDLAELAVDQDTFDSNTAKIRQEYSWVLEDDFRKGRADFFGTLLSREHIYYTPQFRFLFEKRARENLERGMAKLRSVA